MWMLKAVRMLMLRVAWALAGAAICCFLIILIHSRFLRDGKCVLINNMPHVLFTYTGKPHLWGHFSLLPDDFIEEYCRFNFCIYCCFGAHVNIEGAFTEEKKEHKCFVLDPYRLLFAR